MALIGSVVPIFILFLCFVTSTLADQAVCGLPHERGPCLNLTAVWYYDTYHGACARFWYGGCGGNGNRFSSEEECNNVCTHPAPKDACKLPRVKGACDGNLLRWYYDLEKGQCVQFVYGGCIGNDNNFSTKKMCQQQCLLIKT